MNKNSLSVGLWSRSPPESGFWPGVGLGVCPLKETPTPGPYLFHLDLHGM